MGPTLRPLGSAPTITGFTDQGVREPSTGGATKWRGLEAEEEERVVAGAALQGLPCHRESGHCTGGPGQPLKGLGEWTT